MKKRPKKFKKIVKKSEIAKKADSKPGLIRHARKYLEIFAAVFISVVFLIFLVIYYANQLLIQEVKKYELQSLGYNVKVPAYPVIAKFVSPDISARTAVVMEADSQIAVYTKNSELRFSTASTAKIMTAIVALEYYSDKSALTINTPVVQGSYLGFQKGERFYFKDLLYAMLLPSSNEAAYAIAENYPGGDRAFVEGMNEKAGQLHLTNTHFNDPAGLDDDNNYSTALDLARLAAYAMKNQSIASIVSTKQTVISDITNSGHFQLDNLNKLLGIEGVNGIKTGKTRGADEVLITSILNKGHTFIIVVMKSQQRFVDTKTLMSMISNVEFITPEYPNSLYTIGYK